jgi:hypothetical protein
VDLAGAQVECVAAELGEAVLEAHPRARRGGLEDHREVVAGQERRQRPPAPERLEARREHEEVLELLARVVEVGQVVAAAELPERRQQSLEVHGDAPRQVNVCSAARPARAA